MKSSASWFVYMLRCADDTLYTGITTDLTRRIAEHNSAKKAAKYTKVRQPVALVYSVTLGSRSEALKKEAALKKLTRKEKLAFIEHPHLQS